MSSGWGGKTGFNESHAYPSHEGKCSKQTEGLITRTACLKVLEEGYTILPSEPLGEPITCGTNETCKVTPRGSYVMKIEGIEPLYFGFNWEQLYPTNGTNLAPLDAEGNYVTDMVYTKQGPFTGELAIKPILWYTRGRIIWSIESEFSVVSFAKEVDLQHIIVTPNGCPDAVIALKKIY
ncbi:hypothetical protein DSO57_1035336 [Entomophthora muscae]|uniref:Uncharacterized protein n=1 Tax=Entomophthora muscae TaxID=34485 RepID=A0ACC2ULH8_9FUNG|nr:hypothetical protein DSO57_1035336 [Entomophthora muscae]